MRCLWVTMEDDSDDFVTIGTGFEIQEEDEAPKKHFDKHQQTAVDSKGRRRFHGAFTGGFSAGYFNTVGTKEGWTPTIFKSSRSFRASNEVGNQKPENFMDEEDFEEHGIAPRKFMTKESFTPASKELAERKRAIVQAVTDGKLQSAVPGGIPVEDLIIPSKVSIGAQLLKKMGWKYGQGVGDKQRVTRGEQMTTRKKVYGCSLPTQSHNEENMELNNLQHFLAPKDVQPIDFTPKDNTHGIGYSGINPSNLTFHGSGSLSRVFKPIGSEKHGIKGQAFGVGAFEEDDEDIYSYDDMSDYHFMLDSEKESNRFQNHGWSGPPKRERHKGAIIGFHRASVPTAISKIFLPPNLPQDFTPLHRFNTPETAKREKGGFLTTKDRAILIGEKVPKRNFESVFDIIPEEERRRIEGLQNMARRVHEKSIFDVETQLLESTCFKDDKEQGKVLHFASSSDQSNSVFKPFAKDPDKQKRYDLFLLARKSGKEFELPYNRSITEWEKEREIEEFSRASILFRPMSTSMSSRFTAGTKEDDPFSVGKKKENESEGSSDSEKAAKLGLFGKLTRQTHDWYPGSLLCKRFNIPDPYPESRFTGTVGRDKKVGLDWVTAVAKEMKPEQVNMTDNISGESNLDCCSSLDQDASQNDEDRQDTSKRNTFKKLNTPSGPLSYLNEFDVLPKDGDSGIQKDRKEENLEGTAKPSMDLFKAIFTNSSDSSEDESDKDKQNVADKNEERLFQLKNPTSSNTETKDRHLISKEDFSGSKIDNEKEISELQQHLASETKQRGLNDILDEEPFASQEKITENKNGNDGARVEESPDLSSTEAKKFDKGIKESYRMKGTSTETKKRKKKEQKYKKKKRKLKRKKKKNDKTKKHKDYEEESSFEWSSLSDDDGLELSAKGNTEHEKDYKRKKKSVQEKVRNEDGKKERDLALSYGNELGRKDTESVNGYARLLCESEQMRSVGNPREEEFSRKRYEKSERSKKSIKKKKDVRKSRRNTSDSDEPRSQYCSSKANKSGETVPSASDSKETVPSAREIFQKLRKHGLSLKRMSAADFM